MLKLFWLALLFIISCQLFGQNLIPNPGFEQCDKCDASGRKELGINLGANDPIDWNAATYGTPDFVSITPRTGKKHGGFFVGFPKFEYLTNHFTECLKSGANYQFSFWIRPDTRNLNYLIDEIGVYIQKGPAEYFPAEPLKQLTPNFQSNDGDFINQSGYRQFSFEYTAQGGEDHFIVGRFRALGLGDTTFVGTKRPANPSSEPIYYYVDDFEMIETSPGVLVDLIPDEIILCPGDQKQLSIPAPYNQGTITWSTGEHTETIIVPEMDSISVEVILNDNCKTVLKDKCRIRIEKKYDLIIIGVDRICTGKTIELIATCDSCFNFSWNNKTLTISEPGEYTVTANTNCGILTATKKVLPYEDLFTLTIDGVDQICTGDTKTLTAYCDLCSDFSWKTLDITKPGDYTVRAKTNCGELTTTKTVLSINKSIDSLFQFPNIVAPNGEEKSRSFGLFTKTDNETRVMKMHMSIYNRWGQRVFTSNDKMKVWDGNYDNDLSNPAPMDTYMYVCEIEYQDCNQVRSNSFKGTVTLIR